MNKLSMILLMTSAAIITGCSSTNHMYNADEKCITCWNNPLTGNPINHDGSSNQDAGNGHSASDNSQTVKSVSFDKHETMFSVSKNVDVAFLKIKKEFGFMSEEEVKQEMGSMAGMKLQAEDYRWYAVPHVTYSMGSARTIDGHRMNIVIDVEKETDSKSKITVSYWPRDKKLNSETLGNTLVARINSALNK